jgi:hypothetical protein
MAIIGYVSVEARDAQTKDLVRLIGAILPRSNSSCFLAVDVTLVESTNHPKLRRPEGCDWKTIPTDSALVVLFQAMPGEKCGAQFPLICVFSSGQPANASAVAF